MWNPCPLSQLLDIKLWMTELYYSSLSNLTCSPPLPDPQVALCRLHWSGDFAAISTESSHHWRVLRVAIPHLNVIIWWICFFAVDIHADEWHVDIISIGLRYEVNAACQVWVWIWVGGWSQDSTCICVATTTNCKSSIKSWKINFWSNFPEAIHVFCSIFVGPKQG